MLEMLPSRVSSGSIYRSKRLYVSVAEPDSIHDAAATCLHGDRTSKEEMIEVTHSIDEPLIRGHIFAPALVEQAEKLAKCRVRAREPPGQCRQQRGRQ
jgi:hypothetical protein